MLAACCVPQGPWLSASGSGQTATSILVLGHRLLRVLMPLVLWQEKADDRHVPVWHLLCWRTRGQRRLLLGEWMGMPELESNGHVPALSWERGRGEPCGMWAASGSHRASRQPSSPVSPGLPAGSWLSGIHTRMLPECCRITASNVLCVLMDKININLHFFFLFPFYLIFSSPEDFSLLLPPLAGTNKNNSSARTGCGRRVCAQL